MKLFDDFEAIKFPEENLILITSRGYIYYIYNPKYSCWKRYKNAGNDDITVKNYPDVSTEELTKALGGIFPQKETDILRHCNPSQLYPRHLLNLLEEDCLNYMKNVDIRDFVFEFLCKSDICHKSYLKLKELFDNATRYNLNNEEVLTQIKDLSFTIIGRDILKKEIEIVDGHDCSSYFWIHPVRIIDFSDTNDIYNVAEMESVEISIKEDDVDQFLTPFLYKHFDDNLKANCKRIDEYNSVEEHISYKKGFEWYLTHNFYTFDSVKNMLKDISDTIDALSLGKENEFTKKLKEKRGSATYLLIYSRNLTDEEIKEYNNNRPTEDNTKTELIIDFYNRFIYRIKYMMKVGEEKGYNLISFMGP